MWIRRRNHIHDNEVTIIPIDPRPAYSTGRKFASRQKQRQVTLFLDVLHDAAFEAFFHAY
jgi:hypothetical protein